MEVIPAIDLLDGNCVRLNQGDYHKVTQFSSNPKSQAIYWQKNGAKRLHLVDLNGAKTGNISNDEPILEISKSLQIPIQIGGGIRSIERAKQLLNYGIEKVILGTIAIEQPDLVIKLTNMYPGRIIIGIDAKDGKVATRGWITQSEINATDLAREISNQDIAAIISTDISTDGTLEGPNIESLRSIAEVSKVPVIASGGIGSIADLLSLIPLEEQGVKGVIVGRALYDKKFDLKNAQKALSSPRLQDFTKTNSYFA
ncbi:1-(5-phosphoribosyl)-5-[(5-phosphoribosylamino)methylideneamino]imidazole-4-carboxamide isomerase [Prochlorococcus sp. MIT 1223]|uniref:1-(5-phosphoribosyl)-5-[(5- phosphoribosylamino)methylideneamino]imidazole-4- carboxamide isomerase n=1 Tax=Prochlorococcus sp. MIT 1223 TaxID=3096217 RepID=UPI002A75B8B6|nr:1-(5-phosphoribosyl)-5-[(5-phosphoribosylamino)methylideneamino]imidazole-4-carboxamide isomerase [Prochlorococcus sp. MIT 1223]